MNGYNIASSARFVDARHASGLVILTQKPLKGLHCLNTMTLFTPFHLAATSGATPLCEASNARTGLVV
jgi:hypothetical protein